MKLTVCLILLFFCVSCTTTNSEHPSIKNHVSKIVTTRAYSAKQEFDKLIEDKPAYNIGYDKSIGMDFKWNTKHYDSFGNVLYQEDFTINDKGEELIYRKTTKDYYEPAKAKLSIIIEDSQIGGVIEKNYVRDNEGRLIEILVSSKAKMTEKTKLSYNESGQKIRSEVFKENGLFEYSSFMYDTQSLKDGKLVEEIHEVFGDYNYREEFQYEKSDDNQILKVKRKYFESGILKSETLTTYTGFINKIPTIETTEGYDSPMMRSDGTVIQSNAYIRTTRYKLNENGDIIEYKVDSEYLSTDKPSHSYLDAPLIQQFKCEYTYNEKKEWIKIIFQAYGKDKYIIKRDIKYLD